MGQNRVPSRPPEVILKPFDVILAEIRTALDLNEHKGFVTGVADTVETTDGHVNRITRTNPSGDPFKDHFADASNDEPMLGSMVVALITQPFPRLHHD